jgi:hypothetical protein
MNNCHKLNMNWNWMIQKGGKCSNWNKDDWYSVKMGNGLTEHKADRRSKNIVNSIKNTYSVYD